MSELDFIVRVLKVFDMVNVADRDVLLWRTDGEYAPVMFFINCSDFFDWGCADGERVTRENVAELEQAIADAEAVDKIAGSIEGPLLFCARVRKRRPQGACYENLDPRLWHLFDACGPKS